MPWTNQTGGNGGGSGSGGGGRGPWGRGPSGGGPTQPPDLEELLRRSQERLRRMIPSGGFNAGGLIILALGIAVVWLMSGIYIVNPDEQGVVQRFGKFVARTAPGINYHLPWPIETAHTPSVTRENQINIGYQAPEGGENSSTEDVHEESLMLTGDENIVDINFTVFWVIKDAAAFLFNVQNPGDNPDVTIKAVAESAMREVVGQNQIEPILTQDREQLQIQVRELMQKTLDSYGAGVTITRVQMQKADPPGEVIDAYRDVQAARADQERMRNEAEAYANKIIPEARGNAARIVQQAEAYKQQVIAEASGTAKRFISVYDEYRKAPEVTRRRMYLETMSHILGPANKVILDESASRGVVPYLPLPGLKAPESVTVTAPSPAGTRTGDTAQQSGGGQ
jgi:modulator of FtsH protease HflK